MILSEKWSRILQTANLYLCFLTLGLCASIPGPCLLDLMNLVKTDIGHITLIFTARSGGYLFGSIAGGMLLDRSQSKLPLLCISNFLNAVSTLAIPWSWRLEFLAGCMTVGGMMLGVVDTGCNVLCLTLWGKDSGPFYQALHFTFGLGSLVAPLLAAPFVGEHEDKAEGGTDNSTSFNSTLLEPKSIPDIFYPFTAIGGFALLVTVILMITTAVTPIREKKTKDEETENNKVSRAFIVLIVFLNALLLFVETGTEIGFAQMLTTYAVKGNLKLPTATGSFMTSAFWTSFTACRLASVFLAIRISNFTLMISDLIVTGAGGVILLFSMSYEWALWVASVTLGAGIASFYPATIGWLNTYIRVTNTMSATFTIGAAFGDMVIPVTISYIMMTTPEALVYVVVASCILTTIMVVILYLLFRNKPKRMEQNVKVSKEREKY